MDGTWDKTDEYYGEKGLTECLKRMAAINDPNEAIADLLAFLGEKCFARRAYIFEKSENHPSAILMNGVRRELPPKKCCFKTNLWI